MRWTVEEVACALGVTPPGGLDPLARLAGVSIDSRTLARCELFVAIHGPRHDGHNFVGAALDAGALGAVVAQDRLLGICRIRFVPNSLQLRTRSTRSRRSRRPFERDGDAGWQRSLARREKPLRRKFWRRCWARGSAY